VTSYGLIDDSIKLARSLFPKPSLKVGIFACCTVEVSCFEGLRTAGNFAVYPHRPASNGAKVESKDIDHAGVVLEYLKARIIYFSMISYI
jgi:hypothetical protein